MTTSTMQVDRPSDPRRDPEVSLNRAADVAVPTGRFRAADRTEVLVIAHPGVVLWRLLIAGLAWWGLLGALDGDISGLRYFSQITCFTVAIAATLGVGLAFVGASRWDALLSWCRGASTTYATVTALIFATMLTADYSQFHSLLEHAVVPALAVADWLFFGPGRRQARWVPLTWLALPIGYLALYYHVRSETGRPLYPFINPDAPNFWMWVAVMIAIFTVAGSALWSAGRWRADRVAARAD